MYLKSEWFDHEDRKKSVYDKIGYKGLFLYLLLYKFRVHNQKKEHLFLTSVALLRKESGYSTDEVFMLLKCMKKAKIIEVENISRWDYLIDSKGKVKDRELLIIEAVDTLPLSKDKFEECFYIHIPFDLLDKYVELELNERYIALFCLICKWNNNFEKKMYMSIQKMSSILGFHKDHVHKMISEMNRLYLLSSYRKKRDKGYMYEHYILTSTDEERVEKFLKQHKKNMDKVVKRRNLE